VLCAGGDDFRDYTRTATLDDEGLRWGEVEDSRDLAMLRPVSDAFLADGGMRLLRGNLGRAILKTSAVAPERWTTEAPCRVFSDQESVLRAFQAGELNSDMVVVVRFQGPRANGMPELHKLTPPLGVVQDRGFKVALVTDGRMSGASGKVPAAIHCSPEALGGGPLSGLCDGDIVRVCARDGTIEAVGVDLAARPPADAPPPALGTGRELFTFMRHGVDNAEHGASAMLAAMDTIA
jgi:phosphogluconate dehydratase